MYVCLCVFDKLFTDANEVFSTKQFKRHQSDRYNVGCSKRIGLFRNPEEPPNKRMREDGGMEETEAAPLLEAESQSVKVTEMEVDEEAMDGEESAGDSPSRNQRVDILKWTVSNFMYSTGISTFWISRA